MYIANSIYERRAFKLRMGIKIRLIVSLLLIASFIAWTMAVSTVDIQAIGPKGSSVGFATLNGYIHSLIGVHMSLYVITDWLSLLPFAFCFIFAILGLSQLIKRKSILKVDKSILLLGGFYIVVLVVYLLFEAVAVNYRPVLINGSLEASYPSSTTMLVLCIMLTSEMQLRSRVKSLAGRIIITSTIWLFVTFMVVFRLASGVHWFSDIVGGFLISAALVLAYDFFARMVSRY